MHTYFKTLLLLLVTLSVTGCATWSTGNVKQSKDQKSLVTQKTDSKNIIVTEGDITKHKYVSLGDVTATVNKTTVFNKSPTKENVNESLKEQAAKLGADAVIFVRYGEGGISAFSWGSLEGKGRAVKFKN